MKPPGDANVAVVGAGPYGLSIAAHLQARRVPYRIFGEPMEGWRSHMPREMYLKSSPFSSSISAPAPGHGLADFRAQEGRHPGREREPVPLSEFVRYGLWFQQNCVPELERTAVRHIDRPNGDGFRVTLDSGEEFTSAAVVVATGVSPFAYVPRELTGLRADGLVSHTADHTDLSVFAGRRVVVVGSGQSALETSALLNEAGAQPTVVARSRPSFGPPPEADWAEDRPLHARLLWPEAVMGTGWPLVVCSRGPAAIRHMPARIRAHLLRTVLGPSGAWWLRERVQGRVPVLSGRSLHSAARENGGVRLEMRNPGGDVETLHADHVIAGTGYLVDIDRVELLSPELRRAVRKSAADPPRLAGAPQLSADFQASVPGLYFAGLAAAPTFGPLLRFVCGTGFTASRISASLAADHAT
ncbi:NAD(P)-binding domain-containing protein [Streptomyces spiramyceticus]|uniref:NAD(P)-binding domain-containing protein n=1 Tax=Streptomyces spiramyceticus TaxID=299717 RepID=UPI00237A14A7|nr:NAD(P)-binding domain-containing protein [Streptomyces spiramyceticus]